MSMWDTEPGDMVSDLENMRDVVLGQFLHSGSAFVWWNDLYVQITQDASSVVCMYCGSKKSVATFGTGFAILCPRACERPEVVGGVE